MSDRTPVLQLNNITVLYPGVRALDDVTLDFLSGEIHALVGENGAGKSTMIKTITGAVQPSAGTIEVDGQPVTHMTSAVSRRFGIAAVYQEFTLVPVLSAAENIFLGEFERIGPVLNRRLMKAKATELFEMMNVAIDPDVRVENLTTGYQQVVEIAKAISKKAKILIMDEPSAPLTTSEVEAMLSLLRLLKNAGVTIIYISHRLEEIFRISDRVTVLRDGRYVTTLRTAETDERELIKHMVGRSLTKNYPRRRSAPGATLLSVRKVSGNGVRDISFDVKSGEIVGLGGLIGAGRTELVQMLFGYRKKVSGAIYLRGIDVDIPTPRAAIDRGIALMPEDRKFAGLILEMDVRANISLPSIGKRLSRMLVIDQRAEARLASRYIDDLRIKTPSQGQMVRNLSGGNQQKIVLAKWLAMTPDVLIFDEPTRGIDVETKYEIYTLMNELVAQGKAIIMISSEMDELIGMSDRIVVLCRGRMSSVLHKDEFDQETILAKSAEWVE